MDLEHLKAAELTNARDAAPLGSAQVLVAVKMRERSVERESVIVLLFEGASMVRQALTHNVRDAPLVEEGDRVL